jgi:hypothetical protein
MRPSFRTVIGNTHGEILFYSSLTYLKNIISFCYPSLEKSFSPDERQQRRNHVTRGKNFNTSLQPAAFIDGCAKIAFPDALSSLHLRGDTHPRKMGYRIAYYIYDRVKPGLGKAPSRSASC